MSIVGKLGGIEGQQTISEVVTPGGGSGGTLIVNLVDKGAARFEFDRTLKEVKEALLSGSVVVSYSSEYQLNYCPIVEITNEVIRLCFNGNIQEFYYDSEDDYPHIVWD